MADKMGMAKRRMSDVLTLEMLDQRPRGEAALVVDGEHFTRVVVQGILRAKVSLDISTADFKAMLVPRGKGRRGGAPSIVQVMRNLARAGWRSGCCMRGRPVRRRCRN